MTANLTRVNPPGIRHGSPIEATPVFFWSKGFTLIELLIAVAIVSILAAIALPSYARYAARGKATEAVDALASYRLRMEQAYQDNGSYGVAACSVTPVTGLQYFGFACVLKNAGQGFLATATGAASMAGYNYTIDESGAKQTTSYPGHAANAACWLIAGAEC